jgi:hypothetical protein
VVAKVGERLAVSKQTMHRVHMEKFNLKKLNEVEEKAQYRVEISNRFTALEILDTEVDRLERILTMVYVVQNKPNSSVLRWILIELGKLLESI